MFDVWIQPLATARGLVSNFSPPKRRLRC
jgi:hypothetical protein